MSSTFPVELGNERSVGVPDQQDGGVKHLDLPLAALMCLHTDGASAPPVVLLTLEPCSGGMEGLCGGRYPQSHLR